MQPSASPAKPAPGRTLHNLQRRLERWELAHLRRHAVELAERIERLEAERDTAMDEAARAWQMADFWREQVHDLAHELMEAGKQVGMTPDGQLGAIDSPEDPQ